MLDTLRAIFRRSPAAPHQLEQARDELSPERLDAALTRLRAENPPPDRTEPD